MNPPNNPNRRRRRNRRPSETSIARRALARVRQLERQVEVKYHLTNTSTSNIDWLGDIVRLNDIAAGSTDLTRVGDYVMIKDLEWRIEIAMNAANDQTVRMILYWDKQDTTNACDDVLNTIGITRAPLQPSQWDRRFEIVVLHDSFVTLRQYHAFHTRFHKIPINRHTQFSAGTTTILTGALKFLIIGSEDIVASPKPFCNYSFRVTYTDA